MLNYMLQRVENGELQYYKHSVGELVAYIQQMQIITSEKGKRMSAATGFNSI